MTEEQYKKYQALTQEIKPVKEFLSWCGDKYRERAIGQYSFRIKVFGKSFHLEQAGIGVLKQTTHLIFPLNCKAELLRLWSNIWTKKKRSLKIYDR